MRYGLLVCALGVLWCGAAVGETGLLKQGETGVHRFELSSVDKRAELTLAWSDRSTEFELTLVAPDGTAIGGSVPGIDVRKTPLFYKVRLQRRSGMAWEGTWTARLRLLAAHRKRPTVPYTVTLDLGGGARIDIRGLGGVHRAGDSVVLAAKVRAVGDAGASIEFCRATVVALEAGSEPLELLLLDDGAGPDKTAGDGVFSTRFEWEAPGTYLATVAVDGRSSSGRPFRRDASESVDVRPAREK